jgi:putative transposase
MTSVLTIAAGAVATYKGQTAVVIRLENLENALIKIVETREEKSVPVAALQSVSSVEGDTRDLSTIPAESWEDALNAFAIISPLLGERSHEMVVAAAGKAGIHYTTVYRWLKKFEDSGLVTSLVRKQRRDIGKSRIDAGAEKLIDEVIKTELLTRRKKNITRAYRVLENKARKAGVKNVPHQMTLRRRFYELTPEIREEKRNGLEAARRFKPVRGSVPNADYPYSVIQIDHTVCDVFLVDVEHRLPIGRPWITVAIDVFSRMVVGYYVSFDPPGTLGTGLCIANAILNKEKVLAKLGVDFEWPCQGLPTTLHFDNAREFRGEALRMACEQYGINLHFRKVKTPQYGGHIERLLGTLLKQMQAAPGTTFSGVAAKGDFNPEKDATMTLDDFEKWLANLILGMYHHSTHATLGTTPITRYKQGILGDDERPGIGIMQVVSDPERLRIDFMPMDTRTVQPVGITLFNINYYGDVLRQWIGAPKPGSLRGKQKFIVRWDPRDLSHVWFYDPNLQQYFRIPYRDITHPAISLWELREVQKFLTSQGQDAQNEEVIFRGFDEMLRIEEDSTRKTKKVRLAQERRTRHRSATAASETKQHDDDEVTAQSSSPVPIVILPFDEIEPM